MFHVEHFAAFLPRNVPHGTFRAHRSAGRSCPHASPSLPAVPGGAVQDSIPARGAARLFCLAYRQMKSVPGAALPPLSAPETNTLATRAKCPDHSVRRRTATRPPPRRAETKSRAPGRLLSARGKKPCTHCARSLRTARGVSDIFHDEEKCPFWGKRRMALPGCRAGGRRAGLRLSPVVADSKPVPAALFAFAEGGAPGMPGEAGGCGRYPDIPAPG